MTLLSQRDPLTVMIKYRAYLLQLSMYRLFYGEWTLIVPRKAAEPDSRQSYTPEPMNFDEATELGGDTTAKDIATAVPPPSGIAGEDDDEEMDEESSEDVCTNLLPLRCIIYPTS